MAEWIRSHDVWLHCTTIQMGLHSKPGAGTANQAIHPSGVGKLVAVSIQWMTTVEGCDGKSMQLYDGWHATYAANSANYCTLVSWSLHGSP